VSMLLFQISCKKDAIAETKPSDLPIATKTSLGAVMVDGETITITKEGKISAVPVVADGIIVYGKEEGNSGEPELWKVNVDGTQNQKIDITLPPNFELDIEMGGMKHTQNRIFFAAEDSHLNKHYIYACNLDGSGLTRIIESSEFEME
jgi:hypothetical protein